ncbi:hypothetical protein [Dietzia natronolimnaea]|uniref:hypothetical protein n=1 Tax=Dietzia natronolimnaea TaxID=161920 RepID=UPI001140EE00|nr:hypothetical protein [Dietzia natronolimnaea]
MDLFWTPGWRDFLTLLVAPVATLVGVWLAQRYSANNTLFQIDAADQRFRLELAERHQTNAREALATVLSLQPKMANVALESLAAHARLHAVRELNISEEPAFSDEFLDALNHVTGVSHEVEVAITRAELLVRDELIDTRLERLREAISGVTESSGRIPEQGTNQVMIHQQASAEVDEAFVALKQASREVCSLPLSDESAPPPDR